MYKSEKMQSPDEEYATKPFSFLSSAGMPSLKLPLPCRGTNNFCCKTFQYRAEHNQMYRLKIL